jgi:hypothetical protein
MWGPRFFGIVNPAASWDQPFYWGAGIALVQIAYLCYLNMPLDYIALGANAFLVYGAFGYLVHSNLFYPYELLKQSGLFLFILLCGIIITVIRRREGFLQLPERLQSASLEGSVGLLVLTTIAFGLSFLLVTYVHIGTPFAVGIPLVALLTGRELYYQYIAHKNLTS